MPLALVNKPERDIFNDQYIKAYYTLSHFRNENGKIGFADIVNYAKMIGEEDVIFFVSVMIRADQAFIKEHSEKQKSNEK